ncbi:sugar transport protein 13 [Daucus carota subsp. sativus]|nr:PREDICTED: sugar transport protein 13-like [Daucus carota subsp. sativus]
MVGGGLAPTGGKEFDAKITPIVILSSIMVATGGLMFGYDVGVSGGVTAMPDFLKKFFPVVYNRIQEKGLDSNYCKYNNEALQLFTSSLYLSALLATFLASHTTRNSGRKRTMLMAGIFFMIGVVFNATAINLSMLIFGRLALGCGVGFANQAVPLFLSEIAPTRIRGALNILFQLNVTIGIFSANMVNFGTAKIKGGWGWRLSLGLAGIPAILLTIGSVLVSDTPNSLIERGNLEEGKRVLRKIRGIENVELEFQELVEVSRVAREVKHPFRNLVLRRNRPQLVVAVALQIFQQFTGINAIMFYAPILFDSLGFGGNASLYSAAITGGVNLLSTLAAIKVVDKAGRRILLLKAGVHMFFAQVIIGTVLGIKFKDNSNNLGIAFSILVVIMICTFVSTFAWSWGPLGWLIPSETFPLGMRSAGLSVTVSVNMLFTFIIGQSFLSMLCTLKFGIFLFFSVWVVVMSVFTYYLIPETKNVAIEKMTERVWKQHKVWRKYIVQEDGSEMQDMWDESGVTQV